MVKCANVIESHISSQTWSIPVLALICTKGPINQEIAEMMKQMRRDWLDTTKHKEGIPEEDMHKLYDSIIFK